MGSIFKLLLLGLSYLIPRSKRKWVFGSSMGFGGNTKYLFLNTESKGIRYIWISPTHEECQKVRELGYEAYYRNSLKGIYHCLTSGVWLFNAMLKDIKTTAVGFAFKVNLWHGVGLKKIRYQTESNSFLRGNFRDKVAAVMETYGVIDMIMPPDLFLSTSDMMTKHFCSGFNIDKSRCIEGIYPRCSIFSWNQEQLLDYINKNEKGLVDIVNRVKKSSYTYIYMPTWRDTGLDFFEFSSINLDELDETLVRNDSLMLIKLHPTNKRVETNKPLKNIIFIENDLDVYPLLPLTDCLVTDYSSILYDYILIPNKDVVLYVPDMEYYISNCRDLAFPFEENVCGAIVSKFDVLLQCISNHKDICLDDKYREDIEKLCDKFWSKDALSQEEIVDEIKKRVGIK